MVPIRPAPPARIVEVGCGDGALAAALATVGYDVTGVDRNAAMAESASRRGVRVLQADIKDVAGEYDVVLFTRSMHHAENLHDTLAHAATLLAPDGQVIVEEFAWEPVDDAAAAFVYGHRAELVAAGLLDADHPSEQLLDAWIAGHQTLHTGSAMLDAIGRIGVNLITSDTSILWRLVDGRGGTWTVPTTQAGQALNAMRDTEEDLIATGELPSVGLLASVHC
ncbi:SAM-dependent methyltransferase [Nakamurella sp. UYEF19]